MRVLCFVSVFVKTRVFEIKHSFLLWTPHSRGQKSAYFSDKLSNDSDRSNKDMNQTFVMWRTLLSRGTQNPLPACKPHASPEEPAKTDLPLLPGGATILCHFWNSVVLRQSRGLSAYALWRDISSCIGSRITHSCKMIQTSISCFSILHNCMYRFQCSVFQDGRRRRKMGVQTDEGGLKQLHFTLLS